MSNSMGAVLFPTPLLRYTVGIMTRQLLILVEAKAMIRNLILAIVVAVGLFSTAAEAGRDEGWAAHDRGDYETELREWRALAMQGDRSAQNQLGEQHWQAHQQSDDQVDDDERGAAVFGREVGKSPHVAESHRRPDCGQDEAVPTRPLFSRIRRHGCPPPKVFSQRA